MSRPRKHTARKLRPSISVKAATYAALVAAAKREGIAVNALVERLDAEVGVQ